MSALNVTIMKSNLAFIILLWSGFPSDINWKYSLYPELCSPHSAGTGSVTTQFQGQPGVGAGDRAWGCVTCARAVQDLINNNLCPWNARRKGEQEEKCLHARELSYLQPCIAIFVLSRKEQLLCSSISLPNAHAGFECGLAQTQTDVPFIQLGLLRILTPLQSEERTFPSGGWGDRAFPKQPLLFHDSLNPFCLACNWTPLIYMHEGCITLREMLWAGGGKIK